MQSKQKYPPVLQMAMEDPNFRKEHQPQTMSNCFIQASINIPEKREKHVYIYI